MTTKRSIDRIVRPMPASDGAGVRLSRAVGTPALPMVDPFLMLDEFRSDDPNDYIAGFPSHPHRGFETVTIMLAGSMEHRDSVGNTGRLGPGSVQWMTAGRGIIHSEMPKQEDGLMWGFQLWVNLPAKDKMTAPRYQDIAGADIPSVEVGPSAEVRVIAGEVGGVKGPVDPGHTAPILLDVRLDDGGHFEQALPEGHNAFLYVYDGRVRISDGEGFSDPVAKAHAVVLRRDGATVRLEAHDGPARAMLFAGRPLDEPVARHGPFVMNTREELVRAFEDYQAGTLATRG